MEWASLHPSCLRLCASWTCMSISFTKLGKICFIIFSNKFPISCSLSSPYGTPLMWMLESLKLSWRLLTLSSFFWDFFLIIVLIRFFLLPYVSNHWFDAWLHPLYCCFPLNSFLFSLVYPSFLTGPFYAVKVLTNFPEHPYMFWTLHLVDCLSPFCLALFSGVLNCSFIWAMFLCLLVLAASLCLFLCIR